MLLEYKRRSRSFSFHTPPPASTSTSVPTPPAPGHLRTMLLVPPSAPRMVRLVSGPLQPTAADAAVPPSSASTRDLRPTRWRPLPLLLRFRSQPDISVLPHWHKSNRKVAIFSACHAENSQGYLDLSHSGLKRDSLK
ncbi:hypothetical protein ElyMa_005661900 [Elysia marginata]|uniref:Uncharacterized protein n=1 Tax=Elysia marginata TaxID=1093978 RepID=A0AAV4FCN5_9GAST|nr:hypothetical protein ElyMa_005661900 [Elysia marginata]